MGSFEDITGQRFGKLIVTKRIENRDNRPYFLCTCDCGKTKEVSSQNLKKGSVQSCGCFRREVKFVDLTGKVFSRMTVLKENGVLGAGKDKKTAYLCRCACGAEKTVRGADLVSKKIVSCGCWRDEKALENIKDVKNTSEDARLSSAMAMYNANYNDGNLTFEQFLEMSSKDCYYCGLPPSNNCNKFIGPNYAKISIENGNFNYNGLDRVNSNLPHNFENLVTSCIACNASKSDMTIDEFKLLIYNSYNHIISNTSYIGDSNKYLKLLNEEHINKEEYNRKNHPAITSAKGMYRNYDDGDLTFEQFLKMTQHHCVYCGCAPKNKYNAFKNRSDASTYSIENGDFIYNGLDRIDSNLPHNVDNLTPACLTCNWSKSNKSVEEYINWVTRAYKHLYSE